MLLLFSTQCHDNHHNWEEHLEEWWAIDPEAEERPALKQWLCDDKLQVCCPEGTFGQDCSPCRVVDDQESNKTFKKTTRLSRYRSYQVISHLLKITNITIKYWKVRKAICFKFKESN